MSQLRLPHPDRDALLCILGTAGRLLGSAGAVNPRPTKGVNPGETLAILFQNTNLASTLAAIFAETLKIGIHVQSIVGQTGPNADTSESYIVASTPLPGALPLFVTGLASLGLLRWRKKRSEATTI